MTRSIEFGVLDEFLMVLRESAERRVRNSDPDIGSDRLDKLTAVDSVESGRYEWISIGGRFRYVVRLSDAAIFGVENDIIKSKQHYGSLFTHEDWCWDSYYPYKRVWYAWEKKEEEGAAAAAGQGRGPKDRGPPAGEGRAVPEGAGREVRRDGTRRQAMGGEGTARGEDRANGRRKRVRRADRDHPGRTEGTPQ